MRKNRCLLLLYIYFIFTIQLTVAQPDLKFKRYTTKDGLAHNNVLSICQDRNGFIWFGTEDGCSRFDGLQYRNFVYDNNKSGTIGYGWVNDIVSDSQYNLWFAIAGPDATLMKYDYEKEQFTDLSSFVRKQLNIVEKGFSFWNISCDTQDRIWFNARSTGFAYYNLATGKIKKYDIPASPKNLLEDAEKNIWFATDMGLVLYNNKDNTFTHFRNDPSNTLSLSSNDCNCIIQDSEGQIWIGTDHGLNRLTEFNAGKAVFERFVHDALDPLSLSNNLVYDICEDRDSNLLIATVNGLCLLDKKSKNIYRYFYNEIDNQSINSNVIRSVFRDRNDNIWIATNEGVGKLQTQKFTSYSHSSYINSVSHNKVQYICEAPNSEIWIATPKGIDIFNRQSEKFRFHIGVTKNNKGLYAAPTVLHPDANNGMWIGTWGGGLKYFEYASNKITNYLTIPETVPVKQLFSVFKDSKYNLWFSLAREGLYAYNLKTKKYKVFIHDNKDVNSLCSSHATIILEDAASNMWIGTDHGLNKLVDFNKGIFKKYLNGLQINCIIEGADKTLWIGTKKGLYKFNRTSGQFTNLTTQDGLPGNDVLGILESLSKNLWISTNKGLVRLTLPEKNLKTKITTFRQEEGLSVGNFQQRSCAKLLDGTMLFGGSHGFCMFQPSNIQKDTLAPILVFTNLKVKNKSVKVGEEINDQVILQKSLTTTQKLILNHKNNAFAIEFIGIHYNMAQYNRYAYRLDGYDTEEIEWFYTDANNREVEYMNLPGGDYVFKVKAANSYGVWSNNIASLNIRILHPWWKTAWFTALCIALFIVLIPIIVKARTYNLKKQKLKLEKTVKQRTKQLQEMNLILKEGKEELEMQAQKMAEMNKKLLQTNANLKAKTTEVEEMSKKVHETDQKQLRFFANISHEFRTPLTLIIGPLDKYLDFPPTVDWNKVNIRNYLQLMQRNAKRLLRLVNQIIDFRKLDQGGKKLNTTNNNIIEFVHEVIALFKVQAESKNIQLIMNCKQLTTDNCDLIKDDASNPSFESRRFWFDPDIMEKILFNLISNAIKYTTVSGTVNVQLSIANNQFSIEICDTGIGIKQENIDKIFDRFYRIESDERYKREGTGIGLAYTKELVEFHKGNISVKSEKNKGSNFTLQFPLTKSSMVTNRNAHLTIDEDIKQPEFVLDYIRTMVGDNVGRELPYTKNNNNTQNSLPVNSSTGKLNQQKSSILLVEDNSDLRTFIKNELDFQYIIYEAENGEMAWEIAAEIIPSLIICDIMMPVMDGIELCKRIKTDENTSHIPLILLTAKSREENIIEGLEIGADDYITKPFNIKVLKTKIANIFTLRKSMLKKFSNSIVIDPSEITNSPLDEQFLQKAIEVVNNNMHDQKFDNDTFVKLMGASRSVVYKKIKTLTNKSVSEFIRNLRLKAAAQIFLQGEESVANASYQVGFTHPNNLTKYFTQTFGKPPRQFIKDNLKR